MGQNASQRAENGLKLVPPQKKHVSPWSAYWGLVYISASLQCIARVLGVEADLE